MNISTPKISKKAITVLSTLGVIGLLYVFYFFVYVAGNELESQEKAFRILDKIGQNIQEKQNNNKKYVTSSVDVLKTHNCLFSTVFEKKDSIKKLYYIYKVDYDKELKRFNTEKGLSFFSYGKYSKNISTDTITKVYYATKADTTKNNRNLYYKESFLQKNDPLDPCLNGSSSDEFWLEFEMSLKDFIKPLLREDVFDELIISRQVDTSIIYQSFNNNIQFKTQDSLFHSNGGLNSSITNTIMIENVRYKTFTYNLKFDAKDNWLITGFIKEKDYHTETRSISFWIIIHSCLFAILLLFAMPMLKLALMNFIERLQRSTIILSGLSIIMGTMLIVLFFLIESNYSHDIERTDTKLTNLSEELKSKLRNELTAIEKQLTYYDTLITRYSSKSNNISLPIRKKNNNCDKLCPDIYKRFNEVFWMDSKGMQTLQIRTREQGSALNLLDDRDYFKHVRDDNLWWPTKKNGDNLFPEGIYLQSIVSWSTGEQEIAFSRNGRNKEFYPIVAITAKFQSVIDAILPMGYGFSVITANGNVLVHSDSNKNLQENFIEESRYDSDLLSAIYAKLERHSTIDYLGIKHRIKIEPLKGTPLFLIVYNNLDHLETSVSETWSITLLFVLGSFGLLGFLLLIIILIRLKTSKLRTKTFFFDWMSPQEEKLGKYKKLLVSNLFVVLLTMGFYYMDRQNEAASIFKMFIIPTLVFALNYEKLNNTNKENRKRYLSASFIALYLLAINLFYFIAIASDEILISLKIILFQVLVIIAFIPYHKLDHWIGNIKLKRFNFNNLRIVYSLFLLTWLFSSAIVPVFYLYKTSYEIESKIWAKHTLLDLSQNIERQIDNKKNAFTFKDLKKEIASSNGSSYQGIYYTFLGAKFLNEVKDKSSTKSSLANQKFEETSAFDSIQYYLRPGYRESIIENRGLVYASSADSTYYWKQSKDSILLTHKLKYKEDYTIRLAQKLDDFFIFFNAKTKPISAFFLIAMSIIFVLGLYYLISFCVNKIYGLEFSNYKKTFDAGLKSIKPIITNNNTILIGLPGSGKTALLKEYYKEDKGGKLKGCLLINCITISQEQDSEEKTSEENYEPYNTIILDNFEYKNDDHVSNSRKLRLLEKLLVTNKHIVIISEIEPIEIFEMYKRAIVEINADDSKISYKNELEIWRHTLGQFIEVYKPLEKVILLNEKHTKLKESKKQMILRELEYGTFLRKLNTIIDQKSTMVKHMEHDDIILYIQQLAKSYYFAIWNALTNKEKLAVYDIANDGFINTTNRSVINSLLKKGLLTYTNNKLRLINKSFANFTLTVLTKEDLKKMDLEVKKKGKWVNIRLIIIIVIVSLIILIGFGKPGFFKNINAIMLAIAGVASFIPSLTRGFSLAQKIK